MNSEQLAQYLPIAKQALLVNGLLILYYILPNLTSFLITALLITLLLAPSTFQQGSCCQQDSCWSFNSIFRCYLDFSGVRSTYGVIKS
jgi:hypothetical protein